MVGKVMWHITHMGVVADIIGTKDEGRKLFAEEVCSKCAHLTKCAAEGFVELESAVIALNFIHQLPRYTHRCLSFESMDKKDGD